MRKQFWGSRVSLRARFMDLIRGQDDEPPELSSAVAGPELPRRDYCEHCVLGPSPIETEDSSHLRKWVWQLKESARFENCRACTRILEFLESRNGQMSHDARLLYRFPVGYRKSPYVECSNDDDSLRRVYEFFTKSEGSTSKEWRSFDQPAPFLDHSMIWRMRAPSGDTSSTEAFDTLKHWLSRCQEEHTLCQPAKDKTLPHRVLEIESIQPLRVRVVEDCPRRERYACLSHRWGPQTGSNSLKTHNLNLYKTGVPEDKFYPVMKDAIAAAFRLDIHFIWVDCYCIIQDDLKDWEIEAADMASIYENAFLTIAATSSESGGPMFSTMEQEVAGFQVTEVEGEPVFVRQRLRHPCILRVNSEGGEDLDHPLLARGWIFQERLLSNRFIHFTRDEIFWECRESTWCECTSGGEEWSEQRKKAPRTRSDDTWGAVTRLYNGTELSFEKDRLPALAGVARRYGETHGKTYLAGLWEEDLPSALVWVDRSGREPRPLEQVAPTWSWASLPHGDDLQFGWWIDTTHACAHILGHSIKPPGANVYAGANCTEITLEGPVLDLRIYKQDDGPYVGRSHNLFLKIQPDFNMDPVDTKNYRVVPDGSSCLLLIHSMPVDYERRKHDMFGIVLLQKDDMDRDAAKFERIGYIASPFPCWNYLDDSNEFTGYCGGPFHPFAGGVENINKRVEVGWLLERAQTRQVTLV